MMKKDAKIANVVQIYGIFLSNILRIEFQRGAFLFGHSLGTLLPLEERGISLL